MSIRTKKIIQLKNDFNDKTLKKSWFFLDKFPKIFNFILYEGYIFRWNLKSKHATQIIVTLLRYIFM